MVPDARVFSSMKNAQKYPWLYDSVVHQGYLSKFCELFCGHCVGRRMQPISKLLNDLLITSALNPTCLVQSALNPTCLLQVRFKALCTKQPTPRTDKGSSSITDNMITFNGISVYNILNFKFKRYSL
jgi:hypothetical protein